MFLFLLTDESKRPSIKKSIIFSMFKFLPITFCCISPFLWNSSFKHEEINFFNKKAFYCRYNFYLPFIQIKAWNKKCENTSNLHFIGIILQLGMWIMKTVGLENPALGL